MTQKLNVSTASSLQSIAAFSTEKPFSVKLVSLVAEKLSKMKRFVINMFLLKKKNFFAKIKRNLEVSSDSEDDYSEIYSNESDSDNSSTSSFYDFSDSSLENSNTDYYSKFLV